MRSWLSPVAAICQQHRLGEHVETHMFLGSMRKGHSLQGYYDSGLFFGPRKILARHTALATTMNHQSPLPVEELLSFSSDYPNVLVTADVRTTAVLELMSRCKDCRKLHLDHQRAKLNA